MQTFASLPPEEQDSLAADLRVLLECGTKAEVDERCREHLWAFAATFFPEYVLDEKTGEPSPPAAFHYELYQEVEDAILGRGTYAPDADPRLRGLAAAAPRGHAKSTIISLFAVIWSLVYHHKGFVVLFSDTDAQAEVIGMNIRKEFEENERLRFYFGDMLGLRVGLKWTMKDFQVVHKDETGRVVWQGRVMTRGTGSSVRGFRSRHVRPDLVIGDDLENDEHVESLEMRTWLKETWWEKAVRPMLHPKYGVIIVVGTILHLDSLLASLLEEDHFYWTRKWTCYKDDGSPMWPERFTLAMLLAEQAHNPVAFASEYLNDPREGTTRAFRPEAARFYRSDWLRRDQNGVWWFRLHRGDGEWEEVPLRLYAGCDPAISEEEEACEFALITFGITPDRSHLVLIQPKLARLDFAAQVATIARVGAFFGLVAVGIETAAYQRALAQMTRSELRDDVRVKELKHGGGKQTKRRRILSLAPLFDQGRIWFRAAADDEPGHWDELERVRVHQEHWALYQQFMQYPKGKLDDGLDGFASGIEAVGSVPFFAEGAFADPRQIPGKVRSLLEAAEQRRRRELAGQGKLPKAA